MHCLCVKEINGIGHHLKKVLEQKFRTNIAGPLGRMFWAIKISAENRCFPDG
jgi:hypothetical protein